MSDDSQRLRYTPPVGALMGLTPDEQWTCTCGYEAEDRDALILHLAGHDA